MQSGLDRLHTLVRRLALEPLNACAELGGLVQGRRRLRQLTRIQQHLLEPRNVLIDDKKALVSVRDRLIRRERAVYVDRIERRLLCEHQLLNELTQRQRLTPFQGHLGRIGGERRVCIFNRELQRLVRFKLRELHLRFGDDRRARLGAVRADRRREGRYVGRHRLCECGVRRLHRDELGKGLLYDLDRGAIAVLLDDHPNLERLAERRDVAILDRLLERRVRILQRLLPPLEVLAEGRMHAARVGAEQNVRLIEARHLWQLRP